MSTSKPRVVVFGGSGFVGSRVVEKLAELGANVVAVSRGGRPPEQVKNEEWAKQVAWVKGDAGAPDVELLKGSDAVVSLIGSAPKPTFSEDAYEKEFSLNGTSNVNVIQAAGEAGVKRVVYLAAKIPGYMDKDSFAYTKGKRVSIEAAEKFASFVE